MIRIEYPKTYDIEPTIRGFVNTFFSWEKTDSGEKVDKHNNVNFLIGKRDLSIMQSILEQKRDETDFLKTMMVTADITAPLYWWKEFENYKHFKIYDKFYLLNHLQGQPLTLDDFSHEKLLTADDLVPFKNHYRDKAVYQSAIKVLKYVIEALNRYRTAYLKTREPVYMDQLLQLLPMSYNQQRLIILSYHTMRKIYKEQRYDSSSEWIDFCVWMESLPYSKEFIQ